MKRERCNNEDIEEQNSEHKKKRLVLQKETKVISILNDDTAICNYFPYFLSRDIATEYYSTLKDSVPWNLEQVVVFGKVHQVARKTCAYGEANTSYRYSGTQKNAIPFDECPALLAIKQMVEQVLSKQFNFALLNFYENGTVGLGPHSDDERDLKADHVIASVSLGAERDFSIVGKTCSYSRQICLSNGSLLTMGGKMQQNYKHSVPKRTKVIHGRINITFRSLNDKTK